MIGMVDESRRAIVTIPVKSHTDESPIEVSVWVDTAFDGDLVFPIGLIKELGLHSLADTEAILADGNKIQIKSFYCFVDWFGENRACQVAANEGKYPLLGTALLDTKILNIDFNLKTVRIT